MYKAKVISIIVLAALVGIVIFQNVEQVNTRVLFVTLSMPLAVLVAVTWLIGEMCGLLIPHLLSKRKVECCAYFKATLVQNRLVDAAILPRIRLHFPSRSPLRQAVRNRSIMRATSGGRR